ncbi:hypothetical protein [Fischerella sp. PCC 9605]|uniref:hypothetical protein n=1 Tax=Fischerella sp. PCC 9605 TaxID=1173024 RepID=UPI0004789176
MLLKGKIYALQLITSDRYHYLTLPLEKEGKFTNFHTQQVQVFVCWVCATFLIVASAGGIGIPIASVKAWGGFSREGDRKYSPVRMREPTFMLWVVL